LSELQTSAEIKGFEKSKDGKQLKRHLDSFMNNIEKKVQKQAREKESDKENVPQDENQSMEVDPLAGIFQNVAPLSSDSEDETTVVEQSSRASTPPSPIITSSQTLPASSEPKNIKKKKADDSASDETLNLRKRERSPTKSPAYFKKPVKLTKFGETPLQMACKKGSLLDVMKYINEGQDVNHKDYSGLTPLHDAVAHGDIEIVEKLIQKNANLNIIGGPERSTPLILAVSDNQVGITKLLLEFNADPHRCDKNGKTASELTTNPKILKLLEKSKSLFEKDETSFELILPSNPKIFVHETGWKNKKKITTKELRELKKKTNLNIISGIKGADVLIAREEVVSESHQFIFLKALYSNVWILSPEYLESKPAAECFLEVFDDCPKRAIEDQARGENDRPFEGLKVFVAKDVSAGIAKGLQEIFKEAGAETLRREPRADSDTVQADQSIIGIGPNFQYTHWIVTDKKTTKMGKVACVSVKWALDCLKMRKIVDF